MSSPRTVLVTGASTGIGAAIVRALDDRGYRVFAGVRRALDGEALANGSRQVEWLLLDVTSEAHRAEAARFVDERTGARGLDGLVNNAGIASGGPLELVPLDVVRQILEVNVVGLLGVTQALLPALRAARGRIVNIGSVAGRVAAPMVGPYAASKHAVEAITDSLRLELGGDGIGVTVIEPGAVHTPIWAKGRELLAASEGLRTPAVEQRYGSRLRTLGRVIDVNERRGIPAARVAETVVRALEARSPKTRYLVGADARLRVFLRWLLPERANDALIGAVLRRLGRRGT